MAILNELLNLRNAVTAALELSIRDKKVAGRASAGQAPGRRRKQHKRRAAHAGSTVATKHSCDLLLRWLTRHQKLQASLPRVLFRRSRCLSALCAVQAGDFASPPFGGFAFVRIWAKYGVPPVQEG
jgi:hypothetical protein